MVEIDEWEEALAVDDAIRAAIRHEGKSDGVDIRGKWGNVMVCNGCNALHNIT